jgi:hypothetical protein
MSDKGWTNDQYDEHIANVEDEREQGIVLSRTLLDSVLHVLAVSEDGGMGDIDFDQLRSAADTAEAWLKPYEPADFQDTMRLL